MKGGLAAVANDHHSRLLRRRSEKVRSKRSCTPARNEMTRNARGCIAEQVAAPGQALRLWLGVLYRSARFLLLGAVSSLSSASEAGPGSAAAAGVSVRRPASPRSLHRAAPSILQCGECAVAEAAERAASGGRGGEGLRRRGPRPRRGDPLMPADDAAGRGAGSSTGKRRQRTSTWRTASATGGVSCRRAPAMSSVVPTGLSNGQRAGIVLRQHAARRPAWTTSGLPRWLLQALAPLLAPPCCLSVAAAGVQAVREHAGVRAYTGCARPVASSPQHHKRTRDG